MRNKDYLEKLKNTKWKKKRSRILKRDNYKCTVCGSEENLQVHHTFYFDNFVQPWEYPDKSLLTVCEKCHYDFHFHNETEIRKNPKKKKIKHKPKKEKKVPVRKPRKIENSNMLL